MSVAGADVVVPVGTTADEPTTHLVPVAENAAYSIPVVGEGMDQTFTGTRDCEQPGVASATLDCAAGGVVVTNSGVSDTVVAVAGTPVVVPAGTTGAAPVQVTVPVAENAGYSIQVTGDQLDQTFTGTRDCEQPQVDGIAVECAEGGVVVTLSNPGAASTTVLVDGTPVVVPAGGTAEALVPVAENEAYEFDILGDELEQTVTGVLDCLLPDPAADQEVDCAEGGVDLTLRNTGQDTATFVVESPALPGGSTAVDVAPGATATVFLPLAEDASTAVRVTSGGEVLLDETITRDCNDVAAGDLSRSQSPQVPAAGLPRTGAAVGVLLATGFGLILAGLGLVRPTRRRMT